MTKLLSSPEIKRVLKAAKDAGDGGNGGNGGGGTGDALLDALISKLPTSGTKWGADERVAWLTMMAMGFQITYGVVAGITIKAQGTSSNDE